MNKLRSIFNWVRAHRLLTLAILLASLAALLLTRAQMRRSNGSLSPPLQRGTIVESVYGIGTVTANHSYQLRSGVVSTVEALFVREGDAVRKGQKLVVLDHVPYQAPFSGTITYLPAKVGEHVFTQGTVLTLVDLADRYVLVSLEQQGALRVRPGQAVVISFDSLRQQNFHGKVVSVYSNDNNFFARIDVEGLPEHILPGMTADVAITLQKHENTLLVPVAALEEGRYVWVKRGLTHKEEVKIGIVDQAMAEVLGGNLQEGERVLIRRNLAP